MILLLIPLVILVAATVQGTIGFGFAIVSLSILSYFLDFREASVIVALSVMASLVSAIWAYWGELKLTTLMICLGGTLLGLPFGLYVFNVVDEIWLIRGTGVLIFLLSAEGLWSMRVPLETQHDLRTSWHWTVIAGVVSGLLTGAVGMGGPPVAAYAARQSWSPREIKVFLLAFTFLSASLRAGGLAAEGWITFSVLAYALLAIPFALLGIFLGLRVSHNIDARLFRGLTMGALLLLSLGMIFRTSAHEPTIEQETATTVEHVDFLTDRH
ncbi:sulfite exporter TauE/SafE family protein [Blastopirellula marina]|uniref:sulfite exporter TauE/SafE family protein n=1 Tax=Blastopirellula marina TaxID=124 RepID=UPI001304E006|nr:sulfite exporter TauE/SafE family protein [Blastopirellula marina]